MDRHISTGKVDGRLAGKTALVTGAGGGMGREIAMLFAAAGAQVAGCDINMAGLAETNEIAAAAGHRLNMAQVDLTSEAQVGAWVDAVAQRHGGIDVLYNNGAGVRFAPLPEMTLDQWRDTLRLELDTVFLPTRAVWSHMIARGSGSIINVASVGGMLGMEAIGMAAHAAGKGGVIAVTRQMAAEGARHWIRANSISPGTILTPATEAVYRNDPAFQRLHGSLPLLGRMGYPLDVGYLALFMASDESAYLTGLNIAVDGGLTAKMGLSTV